MKDSQARKILEELGSYLGQGIASLINIFDPEVVKKIDIENNKDILGEFSEELIGAGQQQQEGLPEALGGGGIDGKVPQGGSQATPDLNKLITNNPL